jgi:hypothetical protein
MRKFSDEICRRNQNILCRITFYENLAVYEIGAKILYGWTGHR